MRLGCCVNMLAGETDPVGRNYLPALKKYRYDYVELPLAQIMDLDDREFDDLLEELRKLSLPCACCNNFFPDFLRLTGAETTPEGIVEAYLEKALARVVALGTEKIIFGSSGAKNIPPGFPYDEAYAQIVALLCHIGELVEPLGITIGLEPLNHREGNLIRTLGESSQLMKDVNSPQIRLMMDYYHFCIEKESIDTLSDWMNDMIHIHIASPENRSFPKPDDLKILYFLKEKGYDGDVSIEAYTDVPERDLAMARNWAGML